EHTEHTEEIRETITARPSERLQELMPIYSGYSFSVLLSFEFFARREDFSPLAPAGRGDGGEGLFSTVSVRAPHPRPLPRNEDEGAYVVAATPRQVFRGE